MAFIFFMFGLAMVLFGTAWGLVTIGAATPLVMTACLVVAGIGICGIARFGTGSDWSSRQARRLRDQHLYNRRRPHHAPAANSR